LVATARSSDVGSAEAIVAAVYDVLSAAAGEPRDWDRMRSLYVPGARLIRVKRGEEGETVHEVMDVEGFIAQTTPYFEANDFYEREIARRVEKYGHIAQAFSTYASYDGVDVLEPFARGINSFQLWNDGERWWIVSICWQRETVELPIPEEYLP
jgi:hypothetical protein